MINWTKHRTSNLNRWSKIHSIKTNNYQLLSEFLNGVTEGFSRKDIVFKTETIFAHFTREITVFFFSLRPSTDLSLQSFIRVIHRLKLKVEATSCYFRWFNNCSSVKNGLTVFTFLADKSVNRFKSQSMFLFYFCCTSPVFPVFPITLKLT